jgi:prepilin-type N-terminal cleavage/methylation domain-containing protein
MKEKITQEQGFTFIEVLIGMVLFVLLLAGTFNLFDSSLVLLKTGQVLADRNEKARAAMNLMKQEMINAYQIVSISGSSITFRAKTGIQDGVNGHTDATTIETVTYQLNNSKLERGMISQASNATLTTPTSFETLISNVSSLSFTQNGKSIKVDLGIRTSASGKSVSTANTNAIVSQTLFIRNL